MVLAAAAVAVLGIVLWRTASDSSGSKAPITAAIETGVEHESATQVRKRSPQPQPPNHRDTETPKAYPTYPSSDARSRLRKAIKQARSRRLAAKPEPANSDAPLQVTPLQLANKTGSTSEWEEQALTTLRELLGECYALAEEEEPGLSGTFGLRFSLTAEPEVGGLVEGLSVMEDYSTIEQAMMRECMLESVYALELEPPPEGVQVDRELTLRFDEESD